MDVGDRTPFKTGASLCQSPPLMRLTRVWLGSPVTRRHHHRGFRSFTLSSLPAPDVELISSVTVPRVIVLLPGGDKRSWAQDIEVNGGYLSCLP